MKEKSMEITNLSVNNFRKKLILVTFCIIHILTFLHQSNYGYEIKTYSHVTLVKEKQNPKYMQSEQMPYLWHLIGNKSSLRRQSDTGT